MSWLTVLPVLTSACMRDVDDSIAVHRWASFIKPGGKSASLKQNIDIGSVHAYLISQGVSAKVRTVRQGADTPLRILSEDEIKGAGRRFRFSGDEPSSAEQLGKKWLYVYADTYGKSELRVSDSTGWSQLVELGVVYPQPHPDGEPTQLSPDSGGDLVTFDVDADRNTLWLSVPGLVKDRWSMVEGEDTSFQLMRVQQLPVPYGDPDQVGLFIVGSRSLQSGLIRIEGGEDHRKVFKFKVHALPSPLC